MYLFTVIYEGVGTTWKNGVTTADIIVERYEVDSGDLHYNVEAWIMENDWIFAEDNNICIDDLKFELTPKENIKSMSMPYEECVICGKNYVFTQGGVLTAAGDVEELMCDRCAAVLDVHGYVTFDDESGQYESKHRMARLQQAYQRISKGEKPNE